MPLPELGPDAALGFSLLYTVELTVTGPGGADTLTRTDYVLVQEPAPQTVFLPLGDAKIKSTNPWTNYGSDTALRVRDRYSSVAWERSGSRIWSSSAEVFRPMVNSGFGPCSCAQPPLSPSMPARVITATKMLGGGEEATITFDVSGLEVGGDYTPGVFIGTDYNQDIVWSDGYFVRAPGGVNAPVAP